MNKNNLTCIIDDNYYNTNEILDIENYKTFVIEIRHATSVYTVPEGKDGDVITVRNTCEDYVDNPLGELSACLQRNITFDQTPHLAISQDIIG